MIRIKGLRSGIQEPLLRVPDPPLQCRDIIVIEPGP